MKQKTALLLSLLLLSVSSVQATYNSDFKAADLSKDGEQAYYKLLNARFFSIGLIGFSPRQSEQELALRVLLREKKVVQALKNLLSSATPEGSLYALFGLRITDIKIFNQELKSYKSLPEPPERVFDPEGRLKIPVANVMTAYGCDIFNVNRQEVVSSIEAGNYDEEFKLNKTTVK